MVREVKTLWFREKSALDDPLITLPFVGDVSPRKLIVGAAGALIGYLATSFVGGVTQLLAIGVGFAVGAAIAKEPRAVDPFKQLLYALTCSYKPPVARPSRQREAPRRAKSEEVARIVLSELEPIKIHGVVINPYSGNPMAGAELELLVNGKRVSKTVSDSNGRYTFYVRLEPGQHLIEVRLGDITILRKKVVIAVRKR